MKIPLSYIEYELFTQSGDLTFKCDFIYKVGVASIHEGVVLHTKWEWSAYMRLWFYIQSGSGQHTCGCGFTYKVGVVSIHEGVVLHTKWEWPAHTWVWFYIQSGSGQHS